MQKINILLCVHSTGLDLSIEIKCYGEKKSERDISFTVQPYSRDNLLL